MSTIQSVNDAFALAFGASKALRERVKRDLRLASQLRELLGRISAHVANAPWDEERVLEAEFRDDLEPTARSYGFTLVPHPELRSQVIVVEVSQ